MDKQQADHIDHKIRQAAAHAEPPFKEEAWERMEAKLDEDLNRKRRRGFIWWWMFAALILAGGLGVYMYQQDGQQDTEDKKAIPVISEKMVKDPETTTGQPHLKSGSGGKVSMKHPRVSGTDHDINPEVQLAIDKKNNRQQKQKYLPGKKGLETVNRREDKFTKENNLMNEAEKRPASGPEKPVQVIDRSETDSAVTGKIISTKPLATQDKDSVATIPPRKRKDEKNAGFYFIPSVAMDATSLNRFRIKQMRPVFGAAIGYRINNRLGVQTGFYAGKKIYQAGPGDYKTKPGSYLSMVEMIRIGAECNIYEIPLSVRYDILAGKRSRVYAIAGLTSVIMQRETYDYHYRYNNMYRMMDTTYNGNKHLFSLLNVSAGYERKISKALHIQAEPYINFPLSGVGEGKVKLYSAGLRAGIKYTPVKKNKIILK